MHSPLMGWSRNLYLAGIVLALVLVVPTVWFPFQLTKLSAFAIFAAAAVVLFIMGGGMRELTRSHGFKFALLIGLLPLAYLISAGFSVDRSIAFLGFGIEAGTVVFVTLSALAFLMAFALFRTLRTARLLLTVLSGALAVAVVFQLVSIIFGTNVIPFETFTDRSVNLIGKWNDLGLLVGLLFMLLLAQVELGTPTPLWRAVVAGVGFVLAVLLGVINFSLAWALVLFFALALGAVAFITCRASGEGMSRFPVFSGIVAVIAGLFLFFGQSFNVGLTSVFPVSSLEVRPSYQSTMDINAASREGAISRLFFGTGPNTFGQEWLLHKPAEVNQSAFWNVDFNVGFSALSTAFGMVGLVGLLAWMIPLVLIGMAALRAMRRSVLGKEDRAVAGALVVGSLFMFVALAFYAPSQNLILLAFTLFGASFGYLWRQGRESAAPEEEAPSRIVLLGTGVFALALIAVTLITSGVTVRRFVSEIFVNRGVLALQSQEPAAAFTYAARAAGVETTGNALRLAASAGAATMAQIAQDTSLPEEQARTNFEAALGQTVLAGQQAALLNPGDYRPHLILGNVYDFLSQLGVDGAYDAALTAYADAATRNPTNPGLALALARLEGAQGNLEGARARAAEALTLKPNYTDAILFVVQLDVAENDLPSAIAAAQTAAQTAPGVAPIWFQLGLLHYAAGDSANAIAALERATGLVPDYANAKYFLGLSYYAQDRAEDAIRQFEDLSNSNPDNAEVALILGNLRFGNPPFEGAQPPLTPEPEARPEAPIEE